ncbi:MAG: WecB/TagA/CpsF family glycosyltransferase [Candidatus Shapirobacteria bacterium]|nr:WecB/TagA/CpsF family glycosyltransferase [Candidatus Shapirobacteria bacterium]MDD3002648.1 WecB/TagA/CpsF family glycosyltransferase [Candidatus Shapirobacteria bacterium]MDD4382829.1 WecB/TagA/CpsF family glycosyltransferase [Candidatus Shapirobacteria bacterium]
MDLKKGFGGQKNKKNDGVFGLNDWEIFDIRLFGSDMDRVLKIIDGWIVSKAKKKWIATVNPEFVMKSTKDDHFKSLLEKTDLNVVDGVGLLWAHEFIKLSSCKVHQVNKFIKFLDAIKIGGEILKGKHRENLITGVDLMSELCRLAAKKRYKVFFLGGFGDRAKRTMEYFEKDKIKMDYCSGEPKFNNEKVLEKINKFKPDILFVAYGMKKQEEWISNNRNKADFGVVIGVGRSFDYYSGDLKRAPLAWRKIGMEWLYSLIKEPKRFKRQLELPKFMWKVLIKN